MNHFNISFLNVLLDNVSDLVFIMRVDHNETFIYEYLNRAAYDKTKYDDWIIGKSIREVNSPKEASFLYERYYQVMESQTIQTYQDSFISEQGERNYSDITLIPFLDKHEQCTYIIAVVKDITREAEITKKLARSEEHFQIIVDNAGDLITLVDHKGEIIFTSPSYEKVLGFDYKEYIGKPFLHNIHSNDHIKVASAMMQAIKKGEYFTVKFQQYNHANKTIWSEANGAPVFDEYNKFKHMVIVTRDISKQKRYEAKLEHFALHDSLTGLPNRRLFKERLTSALEKLQKNKGQLAVIMLDIDNFKDINDQMGHDIGDYVIEEFGRRLSKQIKKEDTIARLGGDEFIILLSGVLGLTHVKSVIDSIQSEIRKPWTIQNNTLKVTTSIGITVVHTNKMTSSAIIKNADTALYEAKNSGGDTYKLKK